MKRCSNCVLPESYPGLTYNQDGICNICASDAKRQVQGEAALLSSFKKDRAPDQAYDCLLAISGGRDSSYAAYYAVKRLGLKVLAYTFDNGFMPDQTWINVKNIVRTLGLNHVVIRNDWGRRNASLVLKSWVRKPSAAMISFLCTGCATGYKSGLGKLTNLYKLPVVFTGGGEPERSFARYLLSGTNEKNKYAMVQGFTRQVLENPFYLHPVSLVSFTNEFFYRFIHKHSSFHSIPLFRYIEWDENEILSKVKSEFDWQTPPDVSTSWRSDCKIHQLRQYLYKNLLGFTKNDEILSGMIRTGKISRQEALDRLDKENTLSTVLLSDICEELGVTLKRVNAALGI